MKILLYLLFLLEFIPFTIFSGFCHLILLLTLDIEGSARIVDTWWKGTTAELRAIYYAQKVPPR